MNWFFGSGDRAKWEEERSRGFISFWFRRTWPLAIAAVVVGGIRLVLSHSSVSWRYVGLWAAALVLGATLGNLAVWWNRERLLKEIKSSRGPAA